MSAIFCLDAFTTIGCYVFENPPAQVENFLREMENISVHVAAGRIDKELLHEIMTAVIDDDLDSEELKLKLFQVINADDR